MSRPFETPAEQLERARTAQAAAYEGYVADRDFLRAALGHLAEHPSSNRADTSELRLGWLWYTSSVVRMAHLADDVDRADAEAARFS
jgi:hypothetical protein